jgi:hypothetical protein
MRRDGINEDDIQEVAYEDYLFELSLRQHLESIYPKLDPIQQEKFMDNILAGDQETTQNAHQTGFIMRTVLPLGETRASDYHANSNSTNNKLEMCFLKTEALVEASDRLSAAFLSIERDSSKLAPEDKYWQACDMLSIAQAISDQVNIRPRKRDDILTACHSFLKPESYRLNTTDKGLVYDQMTYCTAKGGLNLAYDTLCSRLDNKMYPDKASG